MHTAAQFTPFNNAYTKELFGVSYYSEQAYFILVKSTEFDIAVEIFVHNVKVYN